jgi:autotransporter translocation and assembly factor TamB
LPSGVPWWGGSADADVTLPVAPAIDSLTFTFSPGLAPCLPLHDFAAAFTGSTPALMSLVVSVSGRLGSLGAGVGVGGPGFDVRNLVVQQANGSGQIRLNGRIPPQGNSELDVGVRALPFGDLMTLLGREANVKGLLTADAELRGTRAAPLLNMTFKLEEGAISGVPLAIADGTIRHAAGQTTIDGAMRLKDGGALEMNGTIPSSLTLEFPPKFAPAASNVYSVTLLILNSKLPPVAT